MASKPAMPRRKRSRPSEWWAAAPTSKAPQQQDESLPAKRGQSSNPGSQRMIQEAPAAGNRGKRTRSVSHGDSRDVGREVERTLRRGRSSYMEAEAVAAAELAAEVEGANRKKLGRPARTRKEGEVSQPVRRGRSSNTEAELQAGRSAAVENNEAPKEECGGPAAVQVEGDELVNDLAENTRQAKKPDQRAEELGKDVGGKPARKKRQRHAVSQEQDELVGEPAEDPIVLKKRGRPAAVEVEQQADADLQTVGQESKKRPSRPRPVSRAERRPLEPQSINEAEESPNPLQRRRTRSVLRVEEQPIEPQVSNEAAESKPLLRRRSSNTQDESEAIADVATNPPDGKKHGRPSKTGHELDASVDAPLEKTADLPAKPSRRGRSSNTEAELQAAVKSFAKERVPHRKPAKARNAEAEPLADVAAHAKVVANKKRARQSGAEIEEPAMSSARDKGQSKRRKRQQDVETAEPAAPGSKKGVGRTSRNRRSGTVIEVEAATSSFARDRDVPKKGATMSRVAHAESRKSSSKVDPKRKRAELEEVVERPPETKRRRVRRESQQEPASQAHRPSIYQHLAPVTRHVSRQTIELKWEPLSSLCVERISQILQDLQRPVVVQINDDRRRIEANTALQWISRKLISKISKGLPFPPPIRGSREEDFNFEKILEHNRAKEAELTTALHSNELLEAQIAQETAGLESLQAGLMKLEANAKSAATVRKDAGRKLHSLLQSDSLIHEDDRENLGLGDACQSILPFSHTEDEDLQDLAKELNSHLDSIQGNISRAAGISEAMTVARSAVEAILFRHIESYQYDDIVLG